MTSRSIRYLSLVALGLAVTFAAALAAEPKPVSLFDGKSLEGWEGDKKVFRVEEGAIVAGSATEKVAHNDFLCTTKEYGDFELRLKAKLVGAGDNAGIQFRSKRVPNHFEVSGYQCDMGHMTGRSIWGSLYDESRRNKFLAHGDADEATKALKKDDWNEFVIRCVGPRVQISLNGKPMVDYTETDEKVARSGVIALQIDGGGPAVASYKDITIRELMSVR